MLLAQINGLGTLIPIDPGSNQDYRAESDADVSSANKGVSSPQRGKAMVRITLLNEVDLNDILEVVIIGNTPCRAKLISHKRSLLKGQEIELYFDQVFPDGFSESVSKLIYPGGGIIGFTSFEKSKFEDLDMQKNIANILIDFMMTESVDKIKSLALPSCQLKIAAGGDPMASHFCGEPKYGFQKSHPQNDKGEPLYHLATFMTNEFSPLFKHYSDYELLTRISFYLDIKNTDKGWPIESDRFRVLNYLSQQDENPSCKPIEAELKVSFVEKLDVPDCEHSIIEELNLPAEELERYKAFKKTFMKIISNDENIKNKFLGYPDNIRSCVSFEAERLYNKKSYTNVSIGSAVKWQLLLQISPTDQAFRFYDHFGPGVIYFMIKSSDLKRGRFDDVQVVVQKK